MTRCIYLAVIALLGLAVSSAGAHYNMLQPEPASTKRGTPVSITYRWGHPFEHQLFQAPAPAGFFVLSPEGKKTDLLPMLEKAEEPGVEQKPVTIYRLRFTPEQRGDYLFVLNTPPIWMEEDQEYLQDTVSVVLHVQAQKGWDADANQPFEMVPLTRPYGLQPGLVFQAQARMTPLAQTDPNEYVAPALVSRAQAQAQARLSGGLVEIEHANPVPPRELPPDEQITRAAKTDPNGIVSYTLPEAGWWCLTALKEGEPMKDSQGKTVPLLRRATFWVYVDAPLKSGAAP
ncbi:MAG: DUF4198 domain-containing protein [Planctomycetes bacterium]|nr:DUF4198 domain-containing protein [Planctomycetota bacterium]